MHCFQESLGELLLGFFELWGREVSCSASYVDAFWLASEPRLNINNMNIRHIMSCHIIAYHSISYPIISYHIILQYCIIISDVYMMLLSYIILSMIYLKCVLLSMPWARALGSTGFQLDQLFSSLVRETSMKLNNILY